MYGLVFLPYPHESTFLDQRTRNPLPWAQIGAISGAIVILSIVICILHRRFYWVRRLFNRSHESYEFQVNEATKMDLKQTDLSRHKYEINTVVEVDEKYESTLKNSYQPEAQQEPSLVFK